MEFLFENRSARSQKNFEAESGRVEVFAICLGQTQRESNCSEPCRNYFFSMNQKFSNHFPRSDRPTKNLSDHRSCVLSYDVIILN